LESEQEKGYPCQKGGGAYRHRGARGKSKENFPPKNLTVVGFVQPPAHRGEGNIPMVVNLSPATKKRGLRRAPPVKGIEDHLRESRSELGKKAGYGEQETIPNAKDRRREERGGGGRSETRRVPFDKIS